MNFLKHILFLLLLISLSAGKVVSQESASLNCLEVQDDGAVTLHWTPPENVSVFVKYTINFSTTGTNYTEIGEITDPSINSYLHSTSNANNGSRYYFITTVYSNIWIESDTLQTIFLQVDNTDPAFAKLYWNAVADPLPEGSSGMYQIYKEYPLNNWSLIHSTEDIAYDDPIIVCNDSINYRIVIENTSGCSSVSNLRGGWFKDENYPVTPIFDSVSIDQNNHIILGWTPSVSGDVTGYIIYQYDEPDWIEIDRTSGSTTTFYIDTVPDPCIELSSYAIASIDSCENKSEATYDHPRRTILLDEVENNVCEATNILSWSAYINAIPELEGYKIFCSKDGDPYTEVGQTDSQTSNYIHDSVETGATYSYYVQAIFGEKSSSSCIKSVTTATYQKPSFIYLTNADVLPTNEVELTMHVDTTVYSCTWEIWRSDTNGSNLYKINSISRSELEDFPLVFTDTTAEAWGGFYNYEIKVLDSCGRESMTSNQLKTIFLGGTIPDEDNILLQWNAFEGWDAGVEKYYIFRMVGGVEPLSPHDSVNAQTFDYTDNINALGGTSQSLTYWIQAVENVGNGYGYSEKSNSNRIGAAPESEMFVANAYRPSDLSPEFKPVFRFFGGTDYVFQIFNRWGQLIFETYDPNVGWNGKHKGQYVPLGTYVYNLAYKNLDATTVSKKGTVTVIY